MIVIVDYGMGNLRSIQNKFERLGAEILISSRTEDLESADRIVLPGVGAFDVGMANLAESGLLRTLQEEVMDRRKPLLGICLGMQLLTDSSEEGKLAGLGWVPGDTRLIRFDPGQTKLRVPHMGWNTLNVKRSNNLLTGVAGDASFYFVHSYYVDCANAEDVVATTHYGRDMASVVQHGNVYGTQFHPEKSHEAGVQILKNFLECN